MLINECEDLDHPPKYHEIGARGDFPAPRTLERASSSRQTPVGEEKAVAYLLDLVKSEYDVGKFLTYYVPPNHCCWLPEAAMIMRVHYFNYVLVCWTDGWMTVGWPKKWWNPESHTRQEILAEEARRRQLVAPQTGLAAWYRDYRWRRRSTPAERAALTDW